MSDSASDKVNARRLRTILLGLVLLLTFEGVLRKAVPTELRIPIFLLKDVLVLTMAYFVVRMPMPAMLSSLWIAYIATAILMIPSIILTAFHDPLLAVFGAKEYLLFPIVGFATFMAFERSRWAEILEYFRWISLLVIPTSILALVQAKLPHDNWLNMSVKGESLESFQAAGELRVSSTFSFVSQYCAFLNTQTFIVFIALNGWSKRNIGWKLATLLLVPAIVIGSFITGSRSAVVGNLAIILLALGLTTMKLKVRAVLQISLVLFVLYLTVLLVDHFSPNSTAAYTERENGRLIGFSQEIKERIIGSFTNFAADKSLRTFWGNGLGVMSNGSDSFSFYASVWRVNFWTETDFSTTLFEGGYYLVLVWYGFRLFVIFKTLGHFLINVTPEYSVAMAFCQAYVIVIGVVGTLAIQPPIAIWWWFGVGTSLLFAWKCIGPPESEEKIEEPEPPAARRKIRGRSLYADVIHSRK